MVGKVTNSSADFFENSYISSDHRLTKKMSVKIKIIRTNSNTIRFIDRKTLYMQNTTMNFSGNKCSILQFDNSKELSFLVY